MYTASLMYLVFECYEGFIVLLGLIDHLYAKFAPRYENFVDSAILKSTDCRFYISSTNASSIFGHF